VYIFLQNLATGLSRSRDLVGAHQNLNDSRDLTILTALS